MRKRLRKKKHLREFQELGFFLSFTFPERLSIQERETLLDGFIRDAIEANGLQFGGGGPNNTCEGFVALDKKRGSTTEKHRQAVAEWLEKQPQVVSCEVGPLVDAWYGFGE